MYLGQWIPPDFWSVHSGSSKRLKYRFSSLICGSSQFHLSKNLEIENNDGKSEKNISEYIYDMYRDVLTPENHLV